jgi:hypothetical protein
VSGTVNISRDIWDDTAFKAQPFTEREAFMWLVMEASWKPREKRVGSVVVSLDRGQLATSLRFMGEAWDWPKSTVDRFLKRLEKRDMIGTADGTGVTVITIRKYNEYQGGAKQSGTPENEKAGQHRDSSGTNENKGLIPEVSKKEEAKASSKKARGSRLSADWFLPMDWGQWAVSEGMTEADIRAESEKFKDYWMARAGPTAAKLDWQATWRNWVRTALERKPQLTAITGGRNERQRFDTAHREYTRRLAAGQIERGPDPSDPFGGR